MPNMPADRSTFICSTATYQEPRFTLSWSTRADSSKQASQAADSLEALAKEYEAKLRDAGFSVRQGMNALDRIASGRGSRNVNPTAERDEISQLEALAKQVFPETWRDWLQSRCPLLGDECPVERMRTRRGRAKVRNLLRAYENAC